MNQVYTVCREFQRLKHKVEFTLQQLLWLLKCELFLVFQFLALFVLDEHLIHILNMNKYHFHLLKI